MQKRKSVTGQHAMGYAFLYPEPEKRGRGKKSVAINCAESAGFSEQRLKLRRQPPQNRRVEVTRCGARAAWRDGQGRRPMLRVQARRPDTLHHAANVAAPGGKGEAKRHETGPRDQR
jgi:hypothetical protein